MSLLLSPRPPFRAAPLRRVLFGLLAAAGALMLLGLALLAAWIATVAGTAPGVHEIRRLRVERPSVLLSADGQTLARFQRVNRQWVALEEVARPVIDALIATEDRRFYDHRGIDLRRSLIAAAMSLAGERQGGSTLSQQLARNLFPAEIGRAPTLERKLKEAVTAWKLERAYSKREILELYLNTAPFLYNANGIEMAARTYFGTRAALLTPPQAATLIAMLKGPAAYNPVRNPERALARRNLVLARMAAQGRLAQADFEVLRERPLELAFSPQEDPATAPHFTDQVRRALAAWAEREGHDLEADGLVIETTLDTRLQRLAVAAVERQIEALQAVADVEWAQPSSRRLSTRIEDYARARGRLPAFAHYWNSQPQLVETFVRESPEFARRVAAGQAPGEVLAALRADPDFMARLKAEKTRLQAGLVVLDPVTGEVRAWVGSRDYASDRYDHVAQARRQPGSTFKAFTYAAALEAGMPGDRQFVDAPVAIRLADGRWWQPGDASGASFEPMSLEDGLVYSRNSITAQLVAEIGAPRVAELARRAGVRESPLDPVPSLALGTSPVSLLEMASGYATIARRGSYLAPTLVSRVLDREGRVIGQFRPGPEPALSPDTAGHLLEMLRGVIERGTGRGLRPAFGIRAELAGKTGTSQNNADGWFMLIHPQLVAGAWVGFNDPRVRMRSDYWGQGAHTALYVVGDFFRAALAAGAVDAAARLPRWLPPPPPPPIVTSGDLAAPAGELEATSAQPGVAPEAGEAAPPPAPAVIVVLPSEPPAAAVGPPPEAEAGGGVEVKVEVEGMREEGAGGEGDQAETVDALPAPAEPIPTPTRESPLRYAAPQRRAGLAETPAPPP